jgi:hypothetical protein
MLMLTRRRPRRTALVRVDGKCSHSLHQFEVQKYTARANENRGVNGEEVQDEGFNLANARRRSNSSSYIAGLKDFKTKFETIETEPVFEEGIHDAPDEEELPNARRVNTESSDGSTDDAKSV